MSDKKPLPMNNDPAWLRKKAELEDNQSISVGGLQSDMTDEAEKTAEVITGNMNLPRKKIRHADLKRVGDSLYRSECPFCEPGVLLVYRDQKTLELQAEDTCIHCLRRVFYTDIEELRAKERKES